MEFNRNRNQTNLGLLKQRKITDRQMNCFIFNWFACLFECTGTSVISIDSISLWKH